MARQKTVETDAQPGNPEGHVAEGANKKVRAPKEPRISMIRVWGETFHRAATEGLTREQVIETMIERFPQKAETVHKWLDWYKNFYNMGKIKGFENPAKVLWLSENQANREVAREARRAERESLKLQKEQERQVKIAEKEAKRAEKRAAKEVTQA